MLHGNTSNGLYWEITPDGRLGWADYFAQKGFETIVPDWLGVGRSGYINPSKVDYALLLKAFGQMLEKLGKKVILFTHSNSGPLGWMLMEKYPQFVDKIVAFSPGAMGNIEPLPEIIQETKNTITVKFGPIDYKINLTKPVVVGKDFYLKKFIG